eukprot:CAMPEP_0183445634 /NCGR_PEP_ID=MMETSP0370-20130417/96434_1 /TAXON_ID=268820 /ORGANISM="Peridinium aciculiferum, Strain PAER-2" /LENGTH=269 /DNA_ID=CAMNT_0025636233 /DNA_START=246 /DNA_END=1057 /DNA_ORIENTATION=+
MRTAAAQDLTIDSLWRQFQRSRLLARRRNSSTQRRITTDCWLDVCTIPRSSARSISRATHWSLRLSSATNFECTCAGVRSDARGKERPRIWSEDEEGEHGCKRRQRFADLPGEVSQAWVARRRAPCRHCTAMQREATPSGLLRDASAALRGGGADGTAAGEGAAGAEVRKGSRQRPASSNSKEFSRRRPDHVALNAAGRHPAHTKQRLDVGRAPDGSPPVADGADVLCRAEVSTTSMPEGPTGNPPASRSELAGAETDTATASRLHAEF